MGRGESSSTTRTCRQHIHDAYLDFGAQGGVVVAGHVGKQVVQQLVLHAPPQPLGEEVGGVGVPRGQELVLHPVVLVLPQQLFGLVAHLAQ